MPLMQRSRHFKRKRLIGVTNSNSAVQKVFDSICLVSSLGLEMDGAINTNNQYCVINRLTLNDTNILLAAEIDAVNEKTSTTVVNGIDREQFAKESKTNNNSAPEMVERNCATDPLSAPLSAPISNDSVLPVKKKGPPPRRDSTKKRVAEENKTSELETGTKKLKMDETHVQSGDAGSELLAGYVELKTSKEIENDSKATYNFERFKLFKFWIQSYLGGVPSIVVGFRNDSGILSRIAHYRTSELPDIGRQYWDERRCLTFLKLVLDFVKTRTVDGRIYTLCFRAPFSGIDLIEMPFANHDEYQAKLNRIVPERFHAYLHRMKCLDQ